MENIEILDLNQREAWRVLEIPFSDHFRSVVSLQPIGRDEFLVLGLRPDQDYLKTALVNVKTGSLKNLANHTGVTMMGIQCFSKDSGEALIVTLSTRG